MKSRVSLSGYIGLLFLYMAFLPAAFVSSSVGSTLTAPYPFYANLLRSFLFSAVFIFPLIISRFLFIRSDMDNLLIYGVPRYQLFFSLLIFSSILLFPILMVMINAAQLLTLTYHVPVWTVPAGSIMLVLTSMVLSIITNTGKGRFGFYAIIAVSLLNFSNLIGNPVSIASLDTGNYLYGIIAEVVILAASFGLAAYSIRKYGYLPSLVTRWGRPSTVRKTMNFKGKTGKRAAFRLNFFTNFTVSGNNMGSSNGRLNVRISLYTQCLGIGLFSAALSAFIIYGAKNLSFGNGVPLFGFPVVIFLILGTELVYIFTAMSIANERLWIGMATLGNAGYLRQHINAKGLSALASLSPLLIVPASAILFGYAGDLMPVILITLYFLGSIYPAIVISQIIAAYLFPEQMDEGFTPGRGVFQRFVILIPFGYMVGSALYGLFNLEYLLWSFIGMILISIYLLASRKVMETASFSLIKRGFV